MGGEYRRRKDLLKLQLRDPELINEIDQSLRQAQLLLTPANQHKIGLVTPKGEDNYIAHTPRISAIRKTLKFKRQHRLNGNDLNKFLASSLQESLNNKPLDFFNLTQTQNPMQRDARRSYFTSQRGSIASISDIKSQNEFLTSTPPKTPLRVSQKVRVIKLISDIRHGICQSKDDEAQFTKKLKNHFKPRQQLVNFQSDDQNKEVLWRSTIRPQSVKKRLQRQLKEVYDVKDLKLKQEKSQQVSEMQSQESSSKFSRSALKW